MHELALATSGAATLVWRLASAGEQTAIAMVCTFCPHFVTGFLSVRDRA